MQVSHVSLTLTLPPVKAYWPYLTQQHILDLLRPRVCRSAPKLFPELLEGVTCSKKGLELSPHNIWSSLTLSSRDIAVLKRCFFLELKTMGADLAPPPLGQIGLTKSPRDSSGVVQYRSPAKNCISYFQICILRIVWTKSSNFLCAVQYFFRTDVQRFDNTFLFLEIENIGNVIGKT